jgi:hypothetical protein
VKGTFLYTRGILQGVGVGMQKLPIRMILTVLFLGGSYVVYWASDFTSCEGPKAEGWAEAFLDRDDAAYTDYLTVTGSTTLTEYQDLAYEAQLRYQAQVEQTTPECLENMQSMARSYFFNYWKSYEAASQGNFAQAMAYENEMINAFETMQQEFDRLALEYDWDVE